MCTLDHRQEQPDVVVDSGHGTEPHGVPRTTWGSICKVQIFFNADLPQNQMRKDDADIKLGIQEAILKKELSSNVSCQCGSGVGLGKE